MAAVAYLLGAGPWAGSVHIGAWFSLRELRIPSNNHICYITTNLIRKGTVWEDVQLVMQMSFLKINLFMESSIFFHWQ